MYPTTLKLVTILPTGDGVLSCTPTGTFDVQNAIATVAEDRYALVECLFARSSQALGCCVMSTTQHQLSSRVIIRDVASNTGRGRFGPLEEDKHELIVADLEKGARQCNFSEVAVRVAVSVPSESDSIGKLTMIILC